MCIACTVSGRLAQHAGGEVRMTSVACALSDGLLHIGSAMHTLVLSGAGL